MADCNVVAPKSKALKSLVKVIGHNTPLYTAMVTTACGSVNEDVASFTDDFVNWYKENVENKTPTLDMAVKSKIGEAIRNYYYFKHPSAAASARQNNTHNAVAVYGYNSFDDRLFGIRVSGNEILREARNGNDKNETLKTKEEFNKKLRNSEYTKFKALAKKQSKLSDEEWEALEKEYGKVGAVKHILEPMKEALGYETKNAYARFCEMTDNTRIEGQENRTHAQAYFDEVWRDTRLNDIKTQYNKDGVAESSDETKEDITVEEEEDDKALLDEVNAIAQYEHSGLFNTFTKHIGEKLSIYLNTIPRLADTQKILSSKNGNPVLDANGNQTFTYSLDKTNAFNRPDYMSKEEIVNVLYSGRIDYTTGKSMIASIRRAAEEMKGFEGLVKIADDLEKDMNLCNEFYRTFSKIVMTKQELVLSDGKAKLRISNFTANKRTALRFEYLNSIRSSVLDLNAAEYLGKVQAINRLITQYNQELKRNPTLNGSEKATSTKFLNTRRSELIDQITKAYKQILPTIDRNAINYYIIKNKDKSNSVDIVRNMGVLMSHLESIAMYIGETQQAYYNKQSNIAYARQFNRDMKKLRRTTTDDGTKESIRKKYNLSDNVIPEYIDVSQYYAEDYLHHTLANTVGYSLVDTLINFTNVKTEFNSRNVHGNLSSDVINSSMLTFLERRLNSEQGIDTILKERHIDAKNSQYHLSNILVEHTDENGNVINYGLFKKLPSGDYVRTRYATELLGVTLFNGASNSDNNLDALYSEMSKGDYISTAYNAFFNTTNESGSKSNAHIGNDVELASYFMRTPSDAPKNFMIRSIRYKTDDLFVVQNEEEANRKIDEVMNNIPGVRNDFDIIQYVGLTPRAVSINQALRHISNDNISDIQIDGTNISQLASHTVGEHTTVHFVAEDSNGNTINYVLAGTLANREDNRGYILKSPRIVGVGRLVDDNQPAIPYVYLGKLRENIKNRLIKGGRIHRTIDKNHIIFKQYKNIILGELNSANIALSRIFQRKENGVLIRDAKTRELKKNTELREEDLYKQYHYRGKLIENDELTGNVFHSDRFILFNHADPNATEAKNYMDEVIGKGKAIDFLYGGDTFLHTDNQGNVVLTDAQHEAVDAALESYIRDLINDGVARIGEVEQFIKGESTNVENVANFVINYNLAYAGFADLLEGDSKFYKSAQDQLKRAKEVQGSGVPYGNFDLFRENNGIAEDLDEVYEFNRVTDSGTTPIRIAMRNKFTGVTIANTQRTSIEAAKDGILAKQLEAIKYNEYKNDPAYKNLSAAEKHAKAKAEAEKQMAGYAGTTVNDAQSYITFEEWVRRITLRGQLNKYRSLIENILDETKPIDPNTLKEFVQVQKNFYYDLHYNEAMGIVVPRQIKNAEYVLVPRFIQGTELEQVYNLMNKFGIDQLNTEETDKAGKHNVLTLWNQDGELDAELINDINKTENYESNFFTNVDKSKETYDYNYLYTQQETPQHMDAMNKAAIQIMKKILDNIDESSPIYHHKANLMAAYCANIQESFDDFLVDLGMSGIDSEMDKTRLFEMLMDEASRQALDSNMLDYLELDKDGNTRMPLDMGIFSNKLESIAQSMINRIITRQKLPGFHAAQITNVGFTSTNKTPYFLKDEHLFNVKDVDKNEVDIEFYDREKTVGFKGRAAKIYLKGQHEKGYFELVKDAELNRYSVHFKTATANHPGYVGSVVSTKEERNILFKNLEALVPDGAEVSTWGSISEGGIRAIPKLANINNWKKIDTRKLNKKNSKEKVEIGIYRKGNKSKNKRNSYISIDEYNKLDKETKKLYRNSNVSYSKKLRYHSDENGKYAPYIEVLLPANNFKLNRKRKDGTLKTDAELIEELQAEGLDNIIGYRIPTEGKQSICYMKVVGFIPDANGSTIVVPDDWVSQTGSDFDIDSVYGIHYETYIDRHTKQIKKVQFSEKFDDADYNKFVIKQLLRQEQFKDSKYNGVIAKIRKEQNKIYEEKNNELNNLWETLDEDTRNVIIAAHKSVPKRTTNQTKREHYIMLIDKVEEALTEQNNNNNLNNAGQAYLNKIKEIYDIVEKNIGVETSIDKAAKELNLPRREEWLSKTAESLNTREARNNRILDSMIGILSAPEALEENLSRSNFDTIQDIISKEDILDSKLRAERVGRSAYNFLDQASAQDDAMSGARLKAFSVTRDTLLSIANTVKPTVNEKHTIQVTYDLMATNYKGERLYNRETILSTVDKEDIVSDNDRFITIRHKRFGWSRNNRNVVGQLITPYSSQTTAHILDAIKTGAVPNENDYTFGVFKTLPDLGIDYYTAVAFLSNPAISHIVSKYNANKSIYSNGYSNPISDTIKDILIELGYEKDFVDTLNLNDDVQIGSFLKEAAKTNKAIAKLYYDCRDSKKRFNINRFSLNFSTLKARNNNEGAFGSIGEAERQNKLVYDLFNVLKFKQIKSLADHIGSVARVCNPDKFGAKQTLFATNDVFAQLAELGQVSDKTVPILHVDGVPFVKSIYGQFNKASDIYQGQDKSNESAYPSLYKFIRLASGTSIKVNTRLFLTQDEDFRAAIYSLSNTFSDTRRLTEDEYNAFKSYIINDIYKNLPLISDQLVYANGGFINIPESNSELERNRVFGFNQPLETNFTVENLAKPSNDEVNEFLKLTPAQKVQFIQKNFLDTLIFKHVTANAYIARGTDQGKQTIRFTENQANIEDVYEDFRKAFDNDNPIIQAGAIDLLKYAMIVEGFSIKQRAVSKIIANSVLMNPTDEYVGITNGTDVAYNFTQVIKNIKSTFEDTIDALRENFIRANPNFKHIGKHANVEGLTTLDQGIIYLDMNNLNIAVKYSIAQEVKVGNTTSYIGNSYVRLKFKGARNYTLYKINQLESRDIILTPLNDLAYGENSEFSAKEDNNIWPSAAFYKEIVDEIKQNPDMLYNVEEVVDPETNETKTKQTFNSDFIKTTKYYDEIEKYRYNHESADINSTKSFDLNDKNGPHGFNEAIQAIVNGLNNMPADGKIYFQNIALTNYIKELGYDHQSVQTIYLPVQQGKKTVVVPKQVKITKANFSEYAMATKKDRAGKHDYHQIENPTLMKVLQNIDYLTQHSEHDVRIDNVFVAEEFTPQGEKYSTIQEAVEEGVNAFKTYKSQGVEAAITAAEQYRNISENLVASESEYDLLGSIKIQDTFLNNFINGNRNNTGLINDIDHFVVDDISGEELAINDPRVQNLIRNNEALRNKFLKTILTAKSIVAKYQHYRDLDIDSQDEELRPYIRRIKETVNAIESNPKVSEAFERFANDWLTKISTNPDILDDVITIFDGYHSTGFFSAYINDLQESNNPLVQVITSRVMQDITTKDMLAQERVRDERRFVAELQRRARIAGKNIDLKKVVDEHGYLRRAYNQDFADEAERLRNIVREKRKFDGRNEYDYYLAKYEWDMFKYKHINQPAVDEYYRRKLAIENAILGVTPLTTMDEDGYEVEETIPNSEFSNPKYHGHRAIFVRYRSLNDRRNAIYSTISPTGELSDELQTELDKINDELQNLTKEYMVIDGEYVERKAKYDMELSETDEGFEDELIHTKEEREALNAYIKAMQELNNEYYNQSAIDGFDTELQRRLDVIARYEIRDEHGNLFEPMAQLMTHDEYREARNWIAKNARFVQNQEFWDDVAATYRLAGIRNKDNKSPLRQMINDFAKTQEAKDKYGVVDARLLTDDQINVIRREQINGETFDKLGVTSDRTLISNGTPDTNVYTSEFYDKLKGDAIPNSRYLQIVNGWEDSSGVHHRGINEILMPVHHSSSRLVRTDLLSLEDLKELNELYNELRGTKKSSRSKEDAERLSEFIEENVDFNIDESRYDMLNGWAKAKVATNGPEWYMAWVELNREAYIDAEGNLVKQANRFLYGYASPKEEVKDKYLDKDKTLAFNKLDKMLAYNRTQYYYEKYNEMRDKSDDEFNAWYEANHVVNRRTGEVIPIACWITTQPNPNYINEHFEGDKGQWVPSFENTSRALKDGTITESPDSEFGFDFDAFDARNPNYKEGSLLSNYKAGTGFDNNVTLNEFEEELRQHWSDTLNDLCTTNASRRFINEGFMPRQAKAEATNAKMMAKEALKFIGYVESKVGYETFYDDKDINFDNDKTIQMPMLHMLHAKKGVQFKENKPAMPRHADFATTEEYDTALNDYQTQLNAYNEHKAEYNKKLQEENDALMDDNWYQVMENFITQAGHYNAVQDAKYLLYYGEYMLRDWKTFKQKLGFNNLTKDYRNSTENNTEYLKVADDKIHAQYVNWIRRVIYDQHKESNARVTKIMNLIQNITSNTYMMLNFKGGIANITQGDLQMAGEMMAKEYFGAKQWIKARGRWAAAIPSMIRDSYNETATSLESAIIKRMAVIDYDEINGTVSVATGAKYAQRLRDAMFSTQSIGENMMQNGAMFAMMESHRIVENENWQENGQPRFKAVTFGEYSRGVRNATILANLDETQAAEFRKFKEEIKKDPNELKEYARHHRDFGSEFLARQDKATRRRIKEKIDEALDKAKKEFNKDDVHPTLWSQLKLAEDGYLDFKEDSILGSQSREDAWKVMGMFKRKVIAVNKKIHGNYGKLDRAQIEKHWWGSIVMQYHKHIVPGMLKHWRSQGYYNEERGTIEKGCYNALYDFLSLNLRSVQKEVGLTDAQLSTMKSIQATFSSAVKFFTNMGSIIDILPENEKANIKRCAYEIFGMLSAISMAIAVRCMMDDDDDDNFVLNLALYESDRMASESMQYNPFGIYAEGKKLFSQPIAAQSMISDAFKTMGVLSNIIIQGDDYDPYYHSGRFAGRNKAEVYITRRIPIYRQYQAFVNMGADNHYFKLSQNIMGIVDTKAIAEKIKH